jgi:hypothetical protein
MAPYNLAFLFRMEEALQYEYGIGIYWGRIGGGGDVGQNVLRVDVVPSQTNF